MSLHLCYPEDESVQSEENVDKSVDVIGSVNSSVSGNVVSGAAGGKVGVIWMAPPSLEITCVSSPSGLLSTIKVRICFYIITLKLVFKILKFLFCV